MKTKRMLRGILCVILCILTILSISACKLSHRKKTSEDTTSNGETDKSTDKGTLTDYTTNAPDDTDKVTGWDTTSEETENMTDDVTADITDESTAEVTTDIVTEDTTTPVTTEPPATTPVTTKPTTTSPVTEEPTEKTEAPKVLGKYNNANDRVVIYGTCEKGSVITSKAQGSSKSEDNASANGYFYVEQTAGGIITLYATAPGKKTSDSVSVNTTTKSDVAPQVWGGQNSRLFYQGTVQFYLGNVKASSSVVNSTKNYVKNLRKQVCAATGKDTKFIYIICPNPATVYYDEMRSYMYPSGTPKKNKTAAWQFVEALQGEDGFIVPNLYEAFDKYKNEDIFFRTDTHWSELGAFYAYTELMPLIKKDFKNVKTYSLSDFTVKYTDCTAGDMASFLGASGNMRENTPFLYPKFSDTGAYYTARRQSGNSIQTAVGVYPTTSTLNSYDSSMPTCYYVSDSYGAYFLPYAGMSFGKMFGNSGILWNYTMDYELLAREKPDYVMFIYTDRNINASLEQLKTT